MTGDGVGPAAVTRYVLCGLSNRGLVQYALPLLGLDAHGAAAEESYADVARLVALVDPDVERAASFNRWLEQHGRAPIRRYGSIDEVMASGADVAAAIVASVDATHADHIVAALRHGLDVITEKPMVTTTADAQRVVDAERQSNRIVTVGHNFRYPPMHVQLKRLIRDGRIGRVVQVLMEYHVDIVHGSSYYVRWHRAKEHSGGLTLTKSTHHLDLIAWLIGDEPVQVAGFGGLWFYGPEGAHVPRDGTGAPVQGAERHASDPYRKARERRAGVSTGGAEVAHESVLGLPYAQYAGMADISVFDPGIDTVDTVTSVVSYRGGATASYLVNFSSPWEGFRLVVNGTDGQLEVITGQLVDGSAVEGSGVIALRPLFGDPESIPVRAGAGGHGGADPRLRHDLFRGASAESVELGLMASAREGALAVATGEALWRSIDSGSVVPVDIA